MRKIPDCFRWFFAFELERDIRSLSAIDVELEFIY